MIDIETHLGILETEANEDYYKSKQGIRHKAQGSTATRREWAITADDRFTDDNY